MINYVYYWRKKKNLPSASFFSSVHPLTNMTEELCLTVCLSVWSFSRYRFHICIMYTKLLKNRIIQGFNSSVKTLLRIMHLKKCTLHSIILIIAYRLYDTFMLSISLMNPKIKKNNHLITFTRASSYKYFAFATSITRANYIFGFRLRISADIFLILTQACASRYQLSKVIN